MLRILSVAPTTVGITAAAKVVSDRRLIGKVNITGRTGNHFNGSKLNNYTVMPSEDGGIEVIPGPPFKFEPSNINE
jgi:hypothetical protein